MPATITRRSSLAAPADRVWAHATTLSSINAEMGPWLLPVERMRVTVVELGLFFDHRHRSLRALFGAR